MRVLTLRPALWMLLAAVLAFGFAGAVACDDDEATTVEDIEEADDEISGIPPGDEERVLAEGEVVTVQGEVAEVVDPTAVILEGDGGVFEEAPEVLVVSAERILADEGDEVEVSGIVREFVAQEVEGEFNIDFSADVVSAFEGELFIQAEIVTVE